MYQYTNTSVIPNSDQMAYFPVIRKFCCCHRMIDIDRMKMKSEKHNIYAHTEILWWLSMTSWTPNLIYRHRRIVFLFIEEHIDRYCVGYLVAIELNPRHGILKQQHSCPTLYKTHWHSDPTNDLKKRATLQVCCALFIVVLFFFSSPRIFLKRIHTTNIPKASIFFSVRLFLLFQYKRLVTPRSTWTRPLYILL